MSLRDLRRHVGRLAVIGFAGHTVPDDLRRLIETFDLGGVIYFARNVESPFQVAELSREVAGLVRDWPFWIGVDQEGGRVARLRKPFTEWPPMHTLGRSGDDALAARFASALGAELRAVGVNVNYAPVLDVHTNSANPVIGDRALADDPEAVARLGAVVIRELQAAGVAACGKHFPGHGDTSVDSHHVMPIVEHDRRRFDAVEFVPFRRAIAAGVSQIMTAHILAPALDPERIGTFSPAIVQRVLKDTLGFAGVVVSDDLGMKAATADRSLAQAAVEAIRAGCDVVLLCNSTVDEQAEALEALIRAAESGDLSTKRIDDAFRRQHDEKARLRAMMPVAPVSLDRIGGVPHQGVSAEMARWQ